MKKCILAIILYLPFALFAQGNIVAGKDKSTVCAACHGTKGISINPMWPNLANQHASYLIKQLTNMQKGSERSNPLMTSIIANLSATDMEDLAAYYTQLSRAKYKMPDQYKDRGEQLYRSGDAVKHITACIACHGPKGTGNALAGFPSLAGQHAEYTVLQLQAFKEGKRKNDLKQIMRDISGRMSQDDIEAIAHYLEGL